jgi:predicted nucleotidyltransferase
MQTGIIEPNLTQLNQVFNLPYIPDLIAQKLTSLEKSSLSDTDVNFHQREYERLRYQLQEAYELSTLPEAPSAQAALHNLLVRLRVCVS